MGRRLAVATLVMAVLWPGTARADVPGEALIPAPWSWWVGTTVGGAFERASSDKLWGQAGPLSDELGLQSRHDTAVLRIALSAGWRPAPDAVPLLALEVVPSFAWFTFEAPATADGDDRGDFRLDRYLVPVALHVLLVLVDDGPVVALGGGPTLAISHMRQSGHLDTGDSWAVGAGASAVFQVYTAALSDSVPAAVGFEFGWDVLPVEHVNPLLNDGGLVHVLNLMVGVRFVR